MDTETNQNIYEDNDIRYSFPKFFFIFIIIFWLFETETNQKRCEDGKESTKTENNGVANALIEHRRASKEAAPPLASASVTVVIFRREVERRTRGHFFFFFFLLYSVNVKVIKFLLEFVGSDSWKILRTSSTWIKLILTCTKNIQLERILTC